ncbi:hypothetical protein [Pseudanabaena sp. PCC 6802]|nr:hypothetical protein [Pseudanabaena sp. PCC 6802]
MRSPFIEGFYRSDRLSFLFRERSSMIEMFCRSDRLSFLLRERSLISFSQ